MAVFFSSTCRNAILSLLVGSCFASTGHAAPLDLRQFFNGKLHAAGVLENFRDKTRRDFTIAMEASWKGDAGMLVEDVAFADGERQHKVWRFDKTGPGAFVGHREDLTREADVRETAAGVHMSYKAHTPVPSGDTYNLAFEDELTQRDERTVSAVSDITYFLLPVAKLTMTITKASPK